MHAVATQRSLSEAYRKYSDHAHGVDSFLFTMPLSLRVTLCVRFLFVARL